MVALQADGVSHLKLASESSVKHVRHHTMDALQNLLHIGIANLAFRLYTRET